MVAPAHVALVFCHRPDVRPSRVFRVLDSSPGAALARARGCRGAALNATYFDQFPKVSTGSRDGGAAVTGRSGAAVADRVKLEVRQANRPTQSALTFPGQTAVNSDRAAVTRRRRGARAARAVRGTVRSLCRGGRGGRGGRGERSTPRNINGSAHWHGVGRGDTEATPVPGPRRVAGARLVHPAVIGPDVAAIAVAARHRGRRGGGLLAIVRDATAVLDRLRIRTQAFSRVAPVVHHDNRPPVQCHRPAVPGAGRAAGRQCGCRRCFGRGVAIAVGRGARGARGRGRAVGRISGDCGQDAGGFVDVPVCQSAQWRVTTMARGGGRRRCGRRRRGAGPGRAAGRG